MLYQSIVEGVNETKEDTCGLAGCNCNSALPLNPKETSWGLKGPVAYISYHCVSLKNRFLVKGYVFLKKLFYTILCVKQIGL